MAVVTGAGTGIGRAAARALAGRGLGVVCVGRRLDPLRETASLVGSRAFAVAADVSTDAGVAAVAEALAAARVHALVHAAGREGLLTLEETDREAFDALVATNLAAPFFVTRALAERLRDGAGVVFVGSVASVRGRDRHAAYAAAKAGLLGLTVNLAAELAPRVRVNCICVGATRTPMFEQAIREYFAATGASEIPAADRGRLLLGVAEPEQIAASIAYLALDASFSTGTVLYADGGYTAR